MSMAMKLLIKNVLKEHEDTNLKSDAAKDKIASDIYHKLSNLEYIRNEWERKEALKWN